MASLEVEASAMPSGSSWGRCDAASSSQQAQGSQDTSWHRHCKECKFVCLFVLGSLVLGMALLPFDMAHLIGDDGRRVLKIVSWNLACHNDSTPQELSKELLELGGDIILTQEDVEYPEDERAGLKMEGYVRASACRGEELWPEMRAYKSGGRFVQNSVYTRDSAIQVVRNFHCPLSNTSPNPRCAAFVDVLPAGMPLGPQLPLRVASVHLTGGRFVDANWMQFANEQPKQARTVLNWGPEVVAGDLNSYADAQQAADKKRNYQPFKDAQANGKAQGREYLGYSTSGAEEFIRGGMFRVPLDKDTTVYGGTVDHVFVRRSPRVFYAGGGGVSGDFKLSDHNAVYALLSVNVNVDGSDAAPTRAGFVALACALANFVG